MQLIISILILFILINCVLKLSFWRIWQAALFGAVCGAFVIATYPYAILQSKTQLADYLQNTTALQNMAVIIRQQNPAALQEITAVMLETARKGMWKASEQQLNTLASLHTELVEEFGSTGSGFSGGNAKLQEFIAGRVAPQHAAAYKQQIQTMKTVQSPDNKNGMVLKKDEVSSGEQGQKNALNGVWIAGGVLVLFVVLLLVLRKKRKDN